MKIKFYYKKIDFVVVVSSRKEFIRKIKDSLFLIKKIDPQEYSKLKKRLIMVFVSHKSGYSNGFHMPDKIWFTNYSMITKLTVNQLASGLIHEGVHATQPTDISGLKAEKPAISAQKKFLKKLHENTDYLDEYLKNKYWNEIYKDTKSSKHFENLLKALKNNKLKLKKI